MATRRISDSKRRHEANRYIRQLMVKLYDYTDWIVRVDVPITSVNQNGTGRIYVPFLRIAHYVLRIMGNVKTNVV